MPPFASSQLVQEADDMSCLLGDSCSSFDVVQPPKKSVRIDLSYNQVCTIPPVSDMTPHEIASAWFSKAESAFIRDTIIDTIARLNSGEESLDDQDDAYSTTRGLEFFTYHGALKRECNKLRIRRAVLEEQQRQQQAGICNSEKLAAVAAASVGDCTEFALAMAERDEDFALCAMEEYQDDLLLQKANASRSVLNFCCWDYGRALAFFL